jgi:predicted cupin superfamily sugar epimerase
MIGNDFDSFYPEGGTFYYNKALQIRNVCQNTPGWNPGDGRGNRNKYYLIDNLLDDRFKPVRAANYQYHRLAMDVFKDDAEAARKEIYSALEKIRTIQQILPNSVIFKVFFNAKRDELINIFKQADPGLKNRAVELLSRLDPSNSSNYEKIKA